MKKLLQQLVFFVGFGILVAPGKLFAQGPSDSRVRLKLPEGGNLKPVTDNALSVFSNIYSFAFGMAIALATLALIANGIRYIAAFGNEDQIEKARKGLLYSIIGLAILILAYTIASTVDVIFRLQTA